MSREKRCWVVCGTRVLVIVPLMWMGLVRPAAAQESKRETDKQPAVSNPLLLLIRDRAVQNEIGLSGEQKKSIRSTLDETDLLLWSIRDTDAEKGGATLKSLTERVQAKLRSTLSGPQQKRLEQLVRQAQGPSALLAPDVVQKLGITKDQRAELEKIFIEKDREINEIQRNVKGDPKDRQSQIAKLRVDGHQQMLDELTEPQRKQWATMLGKTFDLSKVRATTFKAPELVEGEWINSEPLTLDRLRGQVVALHFWTFG